VTELPYQQRWLDRGTDRLSLHWYDHPDGPIVLLWPAMGVPARYYRPFATALHTAGLAVLVTDLRGTGGSTPPISRATTHGYAELVDDVAAVLAMVKPWRDGRRVVLLGHSLGGQLCVLHLARTGGADVDGLVLVGSGLPYWRHYRGVRRWGLRPFAHGIQLVTNLLGMWPGWGFAGRQPRGVIRNWAHSVHTNALPTLPGVDPATALATVTTPTLAISFGDDNYTPATTVDDLAGRLTAASVQRTHLPTGDHFTWARAPAPVIEPVLGFIRSQ
jgi:predicted alpha/beta hydrolase